MNAPLIAAQSRDGALTEGGVKRRKWTREEDDRIAALYEKGVSPSEIALLFGASRMTIESKIQYWGIRRSHHTRWTEREKQRVFALAKAGLTHAEIASILGRTRKAVEHAMAQIGRAAA
jgi:transposase-like protein